jgi:hypothetical protein
LIQNSPAFATVLVVIALDYFADPSWFTYAKLMPKSVVTYTLPAWDAYSNERSFI